MQNETIALEEHNNEDYRSLMSASVVTCEKFVIEQRMKAFTVCIEFVPKSVV